MNEARGTWPRRAACIAAVLIVSALLSFSCMGFQIARQGGKQYVETVEVELHNQALKNILDRTVNSVFHYRIIPVFIVEGVHRVTGLELPRAITYYLFLVRVLVFAMCFYVFFRFGMSMPEMLFAVFYIYYGTNASFYNEDLNLYEPLNFLFFLIFFALVIDRSDAYLFPTVVVASFNKETAIMMPVLYLAYRWSTGAADVKSAIRNNGKKLLYALAMISASLVIYLCLRYFLSSNILDYLRQDADHYRRGPEVMLINTTNIKVYVQLFLLFNVFLILPFFFWSEKPRPLKRALVVFCPVFFISHYVVCYADEVRYFLILLVVMLPLSIHTLNRLYGRPAVARLDGQSAE